MVNCRIETNHEILVSDILSDLSCLALLVLGTIVRTLRFMNIGPSNAWILGGPWFRGVYTIFDSTDVSTTFDSRCQHFTYFCLCVPCACV